MHASILHDSRITSRRATRRTAEVSNNARRRDFFLWGFLQQQCCGGCINRGAAAGITATAVESSCLFHYDKHVSLSDDCVIPSEDLLCIVHFPLRLLEFIYIVVIASLLVVCSFVRSSSFSSS